MGFDLNNWLRPNIVKLVPYSSARDEYSGAEGIFLDANESPFETGLNRYPDPYQKELKVALSGIKGVAAENLLLGNGSDEVIDLIIRAFCEPGAEEIIVLPPTYGMYKVSAGINNVGVKEVALQADFSLDVDMILNTITKATKVIFICSPNNPTGNLIPREQIRKILDNFSGIVVVDEAYIDYCPSASCTDLLKEYPQLIIMQTLSKAWGLAGIRLGIMIAGPEIIQVMNKVKPPYNVNILTQRIALEAVSNPQQKESWVKAVIEQRKVMEDILNSYSVVEEVFPGDANFLLVKFKDPGKVFRYLLEKKIIVRDRSNVPMCEGSLRLTVGTLQENIKLLTAIKDLEDQAS